MIYAMITCSADPIEDNSWDTMYTFDKRPTNEEIIDRFGPYNFDRFIWIIERDTPFETELQRVPVWSNSGPRQLLGWQQQQVEVVPDSVFDDKSNIVYCPLPSSDDTLQDDRLQEKFLYY